MRSIRTVILWLALVPAAFALSIEAVGHSEIPTNFEQCDALKGLNAEVRESAGLFGSITGFVDFTPTDRFLRFVDEYVAGSLQSLDLRHTLQYHLNLDFTGIESQINSIYDQFANIYPSL